MFQLQVSDLNFTDTAFLKNAVDEMSAQVVAHEVMLKLRNIFGNAKNLSDAIYTGESTLKQFFSMKTPLIGSNAILIANLSVQVLGIVNYEACQAIYRVFRTVINAKNRRALVVYDRHSELELKEIRIEGIPVAIELLSKIIVPEDCYKAFILDEDIAAKDSQLPLLIDQEHTLLQSPVVLRTLKRQCLQQFRVRSLSISDLLKNDQSFPFSEQYSISTRLRIAERLKKEAKNQKKLPKNEKKCLKKDKNHGWLDEKIAKKAGFRDRNEYNVAKVVFLHGVPSLINAMESKKITNANAGKIAQKVMQSRKSI